MRGSAAARVARSSDPGLARLTAAVDFATLVGVGWDPETEVFTPDPAHRLLGYKVCAVAGCGNEAWCSGQLCGGCAGRRAVSPDQALEDFVAAGVSDRRRAGERLCAVCDVAGACRPASANGLCLSCDRVRAARGQTVTAFVDGDESSGPAAARPTLGICAVVSCGRLVARAVHGLCDAHDQAWRRAGRPGLEAFCHDGVPCRGDRRGRVVLRGLPERVVDEVLIGVQGCLVEGRRVMPTDLRAVVDHLRRQHVSSVAEADTTELSGAVHRFLRLSADRAKLVCSDPDSEQANDVWDLRLWGWRGRLSFIGGEALHPNGRPYAPAITQPWLKAAAKAWAADALTSKGPPTVRNVLAAVGLFSQLLTRRPDHGGIPSGLSRADMEAFLARLARLEAAGRLSRYVRGRTVDLFALFLRDCRAMGLTQHGQSLAGLPDHVALHRDDRPPRLRHEGDDVGLALPGVVLAQLLSDENLDALEALGGPSCRAAVELAAGVGRRTSELCGLRLECLDYDEATNANDETHRSPVLVHDMSKVAKVSCRLPIHDREARVISAQQARVRAAFPDTPPDRLALFPRSLKNPDGTKPFSTSWLAVTMRRWVDRLVRLDSDERDPGGRPVPFPRDRVFPYAFRHTFAQRHADAGTPVDTLKALLVHDTVRSTLGYYRVTAKRKRAAQDRLGPLQLDAGARLVRPGVAGLAQAEALRDQVGQVAVPFGTCTEPTNVAADGQSCPFRHRCTGCEYFRTDPSYQPELSAYLAQLLADRERLAGALPQLAEWARRDAAPSDEEIDAVRRLLRANDEALATLDDDDRAALEAAMATIRKHRATLEVSFPVELRGLVRQPTPSVFPTIEADARETNARG